MHSITMSTLPVFSMLSSPIASFAIFNSAAITIEIDEVYRCDDSGCLFPFAILQFDNAKTCVDSCCANTERAEHELVQPRPHPGSLMFHPGGLSHHLLLASIFSSECRPPFAQFLVSTQVVGLVLPTWWVQHSHNGLNSPLSTLLLTRVWPPNISTLLASGPTFSAVVVCQARLPRETIPLCWEASLSVDAVGRLALSASTSYISAVTIAVRF